MVGPNGIAVQPIANVPSAELTLRTSRLVQGGPQAASELCGVIVRPEMQEDQARLLSQHVTMDCRDFDAVGTQSLDDWIDLFSREHEVPRDSCLPAASGLEVNCSRNPRWSGRSDLASIL